MKHDPAVLDALAAVAAGYELPSVVVPRLATLLDPIAAEPASITSVREPLAAVSRHVEDSLTGLRSPAIRSAGRITDIGSGAGLPGLVLAMALPGAHVTLLESVERKCRFLRAAASACGCVNVEVVGSRVEEWREGAESQDVVTARALAPLAVLVEYAAPLLVPGGRLIAWKGAPEGAEVDAGAAAAAVVGLTPEPPIGLPPAAGTAAPRSLYPYLKVEPTPPRFPRRSGIARKRPLAG